MGRRRLNKPAANSKGAAQETRAHAQKYGAVNKELEAALLEFIEDHAEPALRAGAPRRRMLAEEASQNKQCTRRRLAENSRVLCGWHDDAWSDDEALEWYPGCAALKSNDVNCDVYDVVFDDGDGRERVKEGGAAVGFCSWGLDWASPFADEDDEVEEEAVDLEDFPLLTLMMVPRSWRR